MPAAKVSAGGRTMARVSRSLSPLEDAFAHEVGGSCESTTIVVFRRPRRDPDRSWPLRVTSRRVERGDQVRHRELLFSTSPTPDSHAIHRFTASHASARLVHSAIGTPMKKACTS